jgi:DNA-binding GntR family transcriptional regulator
MNLMDVFWKVYRQIHLELGPAPVDLLHQVRDHREIYEAVAAGNKPLASERLQRHFDGIRGKLRAVAAR